MKMYDLFRASHFVKIINILCDNSNVKLIIELRNKMVSFTWFHVLILYA